jgi:hypothetical protein
MIQLDDGISNLIAHLKQRFLRVEIHWHLQIRHGGGRRTHGDANNAPRKAEEHLSFSAGAFARPLVDFVIREMKIRKCG